VGELALHDGSRIAIIGGGPAGTFFAHFALKLARQRGLEIEVIILDGKSFLRQGPPGCNMCAGVISEALLAQLREEGILLPEKRVQRRIDGYWLQTGELGLLLTHPRGQKGAIRTVYRGSGPRFAPKRTDISFDDFLLGHAKDEGARVIEQVVREILFSSDPSQPVRLLCGSAGSPTEIEADLVVGAFGLNTAILQKIVALGFGYLPPRFVHAFQAELPVEAEHMHRRLGNNIYALSPGPGHIRFAVCTPKKEHVTVSVIGFENAGRSDLEELLVHPTMRHLFPSAGALDGQYCCCRPRIPITPAKNPFTDRFVIVGDASCSRYYKNGIESAFVTAQLAAQAAFHSGISRSAFRRDYWRQAKRIIVRDNLYGRLLFKAYDVVSRQALMARAYHRVASSDRGAGPAPRLARQILWNMFTGSTPYRTILFQALDPCLQAMLAIATLGLLVEKIRSLASGKGRDPMRREELPGLER
jgi:flavin-dependent dehydrogenase